MVVTMEEKHDELSCGCGHCNSSGEHKKMKNKKTNFFQKYAFDLIKISMSVILLSLCLIFKFSYLVNLIT